MISRLNSFFIFLCTLFLLTSCQQAPKTIQGVCRSCKPYQINGVWYYPQNHYRYSQTGIASWYGPGFHKRNKANGEPFNQYHISLAHKELPLPTVVRVTNLANGKSIVAVVDDRGPFVDDRIVDLSYGAAIALGMHKAGLCMVKVEALEEESHKFSSHLLKYKGGIEKNGRCWNTIYHQEINSLTKHLALHRMTRKALRHKIKKSEITLDHLLSTKTQKCLNPNFIKKNLSPPIKKKEIKKTNVIHKKNTFLNNNTYRASKKIK